MAASPVLDHQLRKWEQEDEVKGLVGEVSVANGGPIPHDHGDSGHAEYSRSPGGSEQLSGRSIIYREKEIKPNKVYIGGLPHNTREEDLQDGFGKIGRIVKIDVKLGYAFVEFATIEAAEESVRKYHERFFMGNKVRVEMSRGGGRYAKYLAGPNACYKCGEMGHWFKECTNHVVSATGTSPGYIPPIDRIHPSRDYRSPPLRRDYPPYREEYHTRSYSPPSRYPYDYYPSRRLFSPPRDYGAYPPMLPPFRRGEVDGYRMRGPTPPPSRYDAHPGYYPPDDAASHPPRDYYGPPARDYERYDRRPPLPEDRYAPYPPPGARPRTPPLRPPREDFERMEYGLPGQYRGRPMTPPEVRYVEYPPRNVDGRPRRRSQSPPVRSASAAYESYAPGPSGYSGASPPLGPPDAGRDYALQPAAVDG
ncbi:hypothetical protein FA95DRAFT_1605900 [Auriscalpium vulgare]|uniref:Uncharacterized protein n=1 Tax=Auriscalpium vulgare TaxID=40419 RepID=A0ACB8RUF1_9AGAM|nr:hypothetical protein FA95DRAFT_1605900 [Auriscalpium vulgare]